MGTRKRVEQAKKGSVRMRGFDCFTLRTPFDYSVILLVPTATMEVPACSDSLASTPRSVPARPPLTRFGRHHGFVHFLRSKI
jgi:hypothetical protein